MIYCDRCGVEVQVKGLCRDCDEGRAPEVEPVVRRRGGRQPYVASGRRRGPMLKEQRKRVHEEIRTFGALKIPANEIAVHVGVCTATVYNVLRAERVTA